MEGQDGLATRHHDVADPLSRPCTRLLRNWAEAMKHVATALFLTLCASTTAAEAADQAMYCKAMQKDIMAPESFAIFIKQDKIAYVDEQNAYFLNYRVKFERGPELTTEAFHENGQVFVEIYFNKSIITATFTAGVKGRYGCKGTPI